MIWPSLGLILDVIALQISEAVVAGSIAAPLIWYVARKMTRSAIRGHT